jgi:hypothetical protein
VRCSNRYDHIVTSMCVDCLLVCAWTAGVGDVEADCTGEDVWRGKLGLS